MKKQVVTRFAPSPTGYIHIGNVRSAIYPYLIAKQVGGTFILRIEDTDRARFVEGATELIEGTLRWLGLDWDEGPEVGGKNGPYFQTERREIYYEWGRRLIASGRAYADDTPSERIAELREQAKAAGRAFLYRDHRPEVTPEWEVGIPLRFKSEPKDYEFFDEVYGELRAGAETQDDFIMIKADGLPTYNFAHIVDDATMGCTHVVRGQEYLSSMGNYLALYDALGMERPIFVHLPHILGPSGTKKLGKRDGAKSATDYRDDGFLPEAMLNFLACLGWNDGTEQEVFSKEELVEKFALAKIQRASARFDEAKLVWMNGQWIRKLYAENREELYRRAEDFWGAEAVGVPDERKYIIFDIIYDRLKTLGDLAEMTRYFFVDPEIDLAMLTGNKFLSKLSESEMADLLQAAVRKLVAVEDWGTEGLQTAMNELLEETGTKPAVLFCVVRIALSFAPFSPALPDTMRVLGRNVVLARLNAVASALGND